ncbi:MAG: TssA family type VI secretion system protein [Ignavibacteriales bacterium]|nr:TssA family type VI secretion system protein [Ignavibacteriales bacterium]
MADIDIIEISEAVEKYLEPIPGDSPAGIDAISSEEYFKLNMEIPKTEPDYKKIIELCDAILLDKSKDLKIAIWLCFSFFRTEKMQGLKEGLNLVYHLLAKFENNLFPGNIVHRSKALQFLNTPRVYKLVEREDINKSNAAYVIDADKTLSQIIILSEKLFVENVPVLKLFKEALETQAEKANKLLFPPQKEEAKISTPTVERPVSTPSTQIVEATKPQQPSAQTSSSIQEINLSSEKDAVTQLRKTITFFFEYNEEGVTKQRIPENYFVFGLSRQIQWTNLVRPADTDGATLIEAPNKIIRGLVKDWFTNNNFDMLIARVESEFIKENSEFRYWFDAQRYLINALDKKGGNYVFASNDIKHHLASLLKRIPDLPQLKFKDKQTPFADPETIKWINDEVKSVVSSDGTGGAMILPPILGEDYSTINNEYEAACKDLPNNFEMNVLTMQNKINSDDRMKGKFLRKLNLANYFYHQKEYYLAKVNLLELKEVIQNYNLDGWEQALSTAVWQSLYLTNLEIISKSKDKELISKLEKEQEELFYKIAKYNGILAIKLHKQKPK